MEFKFIKTPLDQNFTKVNIKESNIAVSFDEVFGLLENNESFRSQLLNFFQNLDINAFNIECKPVVIDNVNQPFEFVLVPCKDLLSNSPDSGAFTEHFEENELTAVFENLGGDAVLIAPNPNKDNEDFSHLVAFFKNASIEQKHDLLITIGEIASANLGNSPIYINTSGLGVPWLHVRIDDEPKYYQFDKYKAAN